MPFCSFCLSSTCPKAANTAVACDARDALDHSKFLNADGSWNTSLYPMLPEVFSNATPALLHGLAKTTSRTSSFVLPKMSVQAATYYNGGADLGSGDAWINTVTDVNITAARASQLYEIFCHQIEERQLIMHMLSLWKIRCDDEDRSTIISNTKDACEAYRDTQVEAQRMEEKASKDLLESRRSPLASVYSFMSHNFRLGLLTPSDTHMPDGSKFNADKGIILQDFKTLKRVTDQGFWLLMFDDFVRAVTAFNRFGRNDFWDRFKKKLVAQMSGRGVEFVHQLTYESLKFIDQNASSGMDIRKFLEENHYHSEVLSPLESRWERENDSGSSQDPGNSLTDPNIKNKKQTFGPVTLQGQFTEDAKYWARNPSSGKRSICNCYNACKDCDRGVTSGPDKGKCAYWHICNKCKGNHAAEEKDAAGNWVCPKHK